MIRIEGIDGVKAELAAFDAKVQKQAMVASLRDAGAVMESAVRDAAPVKAAGGGKLPEGALKADVRLRVTTSAGQPMAIVDFGSLTYYVARWVEYGHRLVKGGSSSMKRGKLQGSGHQIGDVPAYPFIRPAFERSISASIEAFVVRLKAELKRRG
jgi:hypothetical protein